MFLVDALDCPKCHGRMRIVAAVMEASAVERILSHLGHEPRAPSLTPARAPPERDPIDERPGDFVVRGGEVHTVRKGPIFCECHVIARDDDLDLALVTPPAELEAAAVAVADDASDPLPDDFVWAAGFPRGWRGSDPVIAPGTIAGLDEESWVNLDGTWGNSGGPLCRIVEGKALVMGVLLGNAGDPSWALTDWLRVVDEQAGTYKVGVEQLEARAMALERATAVAAETAPTRRGAVTGERLWNELALQVRLLGSSQALGSGIVAELIGEHFRTGFLRFAPVADLRKLLSPGDLPPSL